MRLISAVKSRLTRFIAMQFDRFASVILVALFVVSVFDSVIVPEQLLKFHAFCVVCEQ